jgi:WSC domain
VDGVYDKSYSLLTAVSHRECFVGNTLRNTTLPSQAGCNMPCAGNASELCGSNNHAQVYQDSSWFSPTAAQLVSALKDYNSSLTQAFSVIDQYESDITEWRLATQSSQSRFRRRLNNVWTPRLISLKDSIITDFNTLSALKQTIRKLSTSRSERLRFRLDGLWDKLADVEPETNRQTILRLFSEGQHKDYIPLQDMPTVRTSWIACYEIFLFDGIWLHSKQIWHYGAYYVFLGHCFTGYFTQYRSW